MRRLFFLFAILSLFVVVISSCGEKAPNGIYVAPTNVIPNPPDDDDNSDTAQSLTALVGDTAFTADAIQVSDTGGLTIVGLDQNLNFLTITLSDTTIGTHPLNNPEPLVTYTKFVILNYFSNLNSAGMPVNGEGTVKITSRKNGRISGTFEAKVCKPDPPADSLQIVNGKFNNIKVD